ncbi:gp53-like domain-containing protein [Yersinia intermedia]|uniref:gp53-like domain-containing protein n=1 Tax=Yersinia intermedia TaxID=631 RepID=UPI0039C67878
MHRIDTPTAQVDKFGSGKNGFTRGNPQTGVPATAFDDDYFDAVQEELAGIVEAAGINLNKTNRAQVLAALKKLFLQSGNNLSEIKSSGPAAVAQTLANLGLGDAAKRTVGISTGSIPDMSFFSSLLSGAGYQKLPGGLIIQWGILTVGVGQLAGSYPIAFPNGALQATVTLADKTAGATAGISLFAEEETFSSKTILTVRPRGTDGLGTTTARFIVIGW